MFTITKTAITGVHYSVCIGLRTIVKRLIPGTQMLHGVGLANPCETQLLTQPWFTSDWIVLTLTNSSLSPINLVTDPFITH